MGNKRRSTSRKRAYFDSQEATVGYQYITLEAAGKLYTSLLPSTLQLESGKQRELEITFVSAEDILMSKVNGEIGGLGWNRSGSYRIGYFA